MLERGSHRAWSLFGFVLLAAPALFWWNEPAERRWHRPLSPLDYTHPAAAQEWIFLASARRLIPPRTAIRIEAADKTREMSLFMLSIGLFPDNAIEPRTYWGHPAIISSQARYVLALECTRDDERTTTPFELPGGCLRRRLL